MGSHARAAGRPKRSDPQFQAWLSLTRPIALVEDTAVLAAPHEFAKDVLESRLRPALTAALAAEIGRDVRVAVTVEALTAEPVSAESDARPTAGPTRSKAGLSRRHGQPEQQGQQRCQYGHEYDEDGRIAANAS